MPSWSRGPIPEPVRILMLGRFGVTVGARDLTADLRRRRRAGDLIKLLALSPNHAMHREKISDLLWPGLDAASASNNLHRALHTARRIFEADQAGSMTRYITLQDGVVRLCPERDLLVDVAEFEAAAASARRVVEPAAYRAAINLYRGDLLPEDVYAEWAMQRREELRSLRLAMLVELAALHEARGEVELAVETIGVVVAAEPAREEASSALMRLHATAGRYGAALRQYETLRAALRRELDAEPGPAARILYEQIRAGQPPATIPVAAASANHQGTPTNLPTPLTLFVGREEVRVEVSRLLSMTRLLTLTGAGGSGKTRLALEVARDLLGAYPDGVWFVELAPVADAALVTRTAASVLGVRERPGVPLLQTLTDHLEHSRMLLILDNCEHVVAEVARLTGSLLRSCPRLKAMATSREPLGLPGETVWTVHPLSLPPEGAPVEDLMKSEAVRLFVNRARSRVPGFEVGEQNARAVTRVCAKLDGMPLAIELATARVGTLAVEQLVGRLDASLDLLRGGPGTNPRQRTMTAALDWSYRLLDPAERDVLARLSVFAGGLTLEAAEAVCPDRAGEPVHESVLRLAEKSLLLVEDAAGATARYRMLEPIRQYAATKLARAGKASETRERHAAYFLSLARTAEPALSSPDPAPWIATLGRELGNIRAALSWAFDEGSADERVEMGLLLAVALARFWDVQGPNEGRRWLERGLARGVEVPPAVRAEALREAGFIAVYEWDPRSIEMLTESLHIYRELGDQRGILLAVENLGHALAHHATPEVAQPIVAEVEALLGGSSDREIQAQLVNFLGFAAEVESDHEETRLRWKEALAIYRELGDLRNMARCLPSLGMITLSHHDVEEAAGYFEEGLAMQRDVRYKAVIFFHLIGLSGVATHRGHLRRAAKLYGACERLRETSGFSLSALASSEYDYEGYLRAVRGGLGEGEFASAWSEGRAMSLDETIEYALGSEDTSKGAADPPSLSRRELEVARLVRQGLKNREVAAELNITERTVETHVSRVLRKLGLRSRTQLVAWMIDNDGSTKTSP